MCSSPGSPGGKDENPKKAEAHEPDELLMGTAAMSTLVTALDEQEANPEAQLRPKILPKSRVEKVKKKAVFPGYATYTKTTALFLDLFHVPERDSKTHAFDLLDGTPAYYYSRRKPTPLPGQTTLEPIERRFDYASQLYRYVMHPAFVREGVDDAGVQVWSQTFPGEREEFVYEGLKRMASIRSVELLDGDVGFRFSLKELQTLLQLTKHSYSIAQIRESIEILCSSSFEISDPGREHVIIGHKLSAAAFNGRGENSNCYVRFDPSVTQAIQTVAYRAMDFNVKMSLQSAVARRLYERMCLYFTYASPSKKYTVAASSALRNASIVAVGRPARWAAVVEEALNELKNKGQIREFIKEEVRNEAVKLIDYKYAITPAIDLYRLIINENQRLAQIRAALGIGAANGTQE